MTEPQTTQPDQTTRAEVFWFAFRRILFSPLGICVMFLLLIVLFYRVEDWRGKRAWRKCKAEFEARGEHLDWAYFIPPAIPDEENFFKAPMMKEWFQKKPLTTKYFPLMEWPEKDDSWDELEAAEPMVVSAHDNSRIPASVITNWFETHYAEEFRILQDACQRPRARMEGDYNTDFSPIPHFVNFRQVAQTLSVRAQAYLQKDRSDLALQDLTLLRRLMDALQASPTLVSTMIRVALGGLYVSSISENLTNEKWTDTQLAILQEQLLSMDFLPHLNRSLRAEVASVTTYAETHSWRKMFGMSQVIGGGKKAFWQTMEDHLENSAAQLIPRGWIYQNMVVYTRLMADHCWTDFDIAQQRILPQFSDRNAAAIMQATTTRGPFNLLAAIAVPNFVKAKQTLAKNQSMAQLAALACALERFRRVESRFPEALDELVPRFIEKLPNDLITGKPPVYRRLADGKYALYSAGWDQTDDGGTGTDWVWPEVAKWK